MVRFLILLPLIPCVICLVLAHLFGVRRIANRGSLSVSGEEVAREVLENVGVEVKLKRSMWAGKNPHKKGVFSLSESLAKSTSVAEISQVLHLCGLVLLEQAHEKSVKHRYRMVKFASVFPFFVILAAVFGKFARGGIFPLHWMLALIALSFGIASLGLLLNIAVEKEAARRAVAAMERCNLILRIDDQEEVAEAIYGHAYLSVLPGPLHFLLGRGFMKSKE